MSFDTNLWNNTTADGFADSEPPLGFQAVTVTDAGFKLTGPDKDKPTIIVEYKTAAGDTWADVKQLTTEGRVKSAKILMRDLGLDPESFSSQDEIHQGLKSIEGKYFDVEVKESASLNKTTGKPYRNTSILGRSQVSASVAPTIESGVVAATADEEMPF